MGALFFVTIESATNPDDDMQDEDISHLLRCGYIRLNIANTIFHPGFILYLSRQQKKYNTLNASLVSNAVGIWNSDISDRRKKIEFKQKHFNRLASLSKNRDGCDHDEECEVNGADLAVLRYWMAYITVEVDGAAKLPQTDIAGLQRLNSENDVDIERALQRIIKDPVGNQLVAHAVMNQVTIQTEHLHKQKGYFEYATRSIVIDPSASCYIFRINTFVHELVHAANPKRDNSIVEESIAEIIAMQVQDRITGVTISCSPYVVFVDRLLDPVYGNYPVTNKIEAHLGAAGLVIRTGDEEDN